MYNLEHSKLRVCGKYIRQERNVQPLIKTRFILLQHILPTTQEFINLLSSSGAEIFSIIAKPYSIEENVFNDLSIRFNLIRETYYNLENTPVLDNILKEAINKSKIDDKKIIILEIGGYFAEPIKKIDKDLVVKYFAGIVEDTTFGHNRYLKNVTEICIPIFSVARSKLKEIEALFVGKDAVMAMDYILRGLGVSISGRRALVIGYGMIGKNVASALEAYNLNVSVYDIRDHRNLKAFLGAGFHVQKKQELLKNADIIFSATGNPAGAVSVNEIEELCKDNVILASVGSKDTEFDIAGLKELAIKTELVNEHITKFTLPSSKVVMTVKEGTAVNFILKSMPVEIIDLVFAEILLCSILLLKTPDRVKIGQLNYLPETYLNSIAKDWLKIVNC